ncbi:hypothetical protein DITRI_Ditri09bG0086300 [Diplodiscus trichospermus]
MHMGILKEALVRTIWDIDITFTKEASKNGIVSGCTSVIVVVANNQILVANVGDSKVVLCSQKFHSLQDIREATGVPRVNGQLAVSRSIGNLHYKRFGVIAVPEVIDWQPLNRNDSYLVISSDGIFEKLNAQHVCQLLPDPLLPTRDEGLRLFDSCQPPFPECILRKAYEEGSMDNLSVIVVPLRVSGLFHESLEPAEMIFLR